MGLCFFFISIAKPFTQKYMAYEIPFLLLIPFITLVFLMKKKHPNRLPPGPQKLPIIGNLHQIGKLPHRSLQNLSKEHGDLMHLQLGSVPALVVSSPNRTRDIFKHHDLAISGRAPLCSLRKITYDLSSITAAPYGDAWRELRKIMILELMTSKQVQSFRKLRDQEVTRLISRISDRFPNPVDLSSLAFSLSNTFVCRAAFGMTNIALEASNGREFQEILQDVQESAGMFNIADYFPGLAWINKINGMDRRLDRNFRDLDRFFDLVIEQHVDPRRPKPEHEDIVDVLVRIQKDPNQTIALKDEQVKGVLTDIFIAGTDTSAATIVWTMAELMRNPIAKEKVQQEVRKIGQDKAKIKEDDLPNLTYLKQVIKESFRLHPPAPLLVPRETIEMCTIDNKYEIPAKTRIFFNAAAISRDPKYWENPEKFFPERFEDSEIDYRGQHYELLPFGSGRRGCPGINFVIPLVELVLANILFYFNWELPEGMLAKDVDMEEAVGITIHKKIPLCLVATPVK